jgi:TRAP transporter TAXI family solute receptor
MKRKGIKMTACVVLITFQIFITLPSVYAASEKEPPKRLQLSILSFAFGSAAYVLCQGLADLINKHSNLLQASAIETKGTVTNALSLAVRPETRKTTLIYTVLTANQWAKAGEEPFKKPYTSLRTVANFQATQDAYVTFNKDIKTFGDLAGKRFAVGPPGASSARLAIERLRYGWGILDKVKVEYMGFEASKDALINGTIDGGFLGNIFVGNKLVTSPAGMELMSQPRKLYWISDTEEALERTKKKTGWPVFYGVTPAGYWGPQQSEAYYYATQYVFFAVDAEMDDQVVTEICRIFWEYSDEFKNYHKSGEAITKPTMAKVPVVREEFHPAAVKFYHAKGIKVGLQDWPEFKKSYLGK